MISQVVEIEPQNWIHFSISKIFETFLNFFPLNVNKILISITYAVKSMGYALV